MTTLTTTTTTTIETGFPYEVIHHMRTQICEYRSLREIEVISFKRNKDKSQRVQNAFVRWHRLRTLKSIRKMFLLNPVCPVQPVELSTFYLVDSVRLTADLHVIVHCKV